MNQQLVSLSGPSRYWYALAASFLVAAVVGGVLGFDSLIRQSSEMQRLVVPGQATITLSKGDYTVYYESSSHLDGTVYATGEEPPSLHCGLVTEAGDSVALESPSGTTTYTVNGYSGVSVLGFTAPAAGAYVLDCAAAEGAQAQPVVLAVGHSMTGILLAVVGAVFGGLAGCIAIAVIVYSKRRSAARAAVSVPRASVVS